MINKVIPHCYICYTTVLGPDIMVCDTCDEIYCEDCSYTFSLHYQHQGARCHWCSDQRRLKPLTKEMLRDNKLKLLLLYL
jgi:hypothetical protein